MTPEQAAALEHLAALNAHLDARIAGQVLALARARCRLRQWRRRQAARQ